MPKRKLKMTKNCIAARKRYRKKKRGGNMIRGMLKRIQPVFSTVRRSTFEKKKKKRGGGGVNWNRGRPMKTTFFKYGRHGKRRAVPNPF